MILHFHSLIRLVGAILLAAIPTAPTLSNAATICDEKDLAVLTTPAPPGNKYSLESFINTTVPANIDFAIIGDSIATQLSLGGLERELHARSPFVLAGGGDGMQHALYRLQSFGASMRFSSPEKALIVIGTNNISFSSCGVGPAFLSYLAKLKNIWPETKYYVLPILPRGDFFVFNEDDRKQYNRFLADNADTYGFSVIKVEENVLTCGIINKLTNESIQTFYDKTTISEKTCTPEVNRGLKKLSKITHLDYSLQCSVRITARCDYYRDDHIHLSEKGLQYLIPIIANQIGRF